MRSETILTIGIIIFIFIAWVYGGGPNRPISFAGPYITPLTNVGVDQRGYGSTSTFSGLRGASYQGAFGGVSYVSQTRSAQETEGQLVSYQQQLSELQKKVNQERLFGNPSPYHGTVTLSGSSVSATDPKQQYVTIYLSSSATAPVTISGWTLSSIATNYHATIPYGDPLPTNNVASARSPITLQPGDSAVIATARSPIGASFKENLCSGYLAQVTTFTPSLYTQCPSARDEFDRFYTGNKYQDKTCYDLIQSTNSCQTPRENSNLSQACYKLIDTYLSYPSCVASHRDNPGFGGRIWHVYLDYHNGTSRNTTTNDLLWRSDHEAIKLLDSNGKTVDLYTSY